MQKTLFEMVRKFAATYHHLMSKAFSELGSYIMVHETKKFEKIAQL